MVKAIDGPSAGVPSATYIYVRADGENKRQVTDSRRWGSQLGPGARAGVPSPPVVKADGVVRTKPHIYEAVMGNTYLILSPCHGGWRVGEADPAIGGGAWIAAAAVSDRDAIRDEEGGRTAAAAATNGGPHLVAEGLITGHTH